MIQKLEGSAIELVGCHNTYGLLDTTKIPVILWFYNNILLWEMVEIYSLIVYANV